MIDPLSLNFRVFTVKLLGIPKFRNFTVPIKHHDLQDDFLI